MRELTAEKNGFAALATKAELREKMQKELTALWGLTQTEKPEEAHTIAQLNACPTVKTECEKAIRTIDAELVKAMSPCSQVRLYYLGVIKNGIPRDAWALLSEPADEKPAKIKLAHKKSRWFLPKGPGLE